MEDLRLLIRTAREGDRDAQDRLLGLYRNFLALLARTSLDRNLKAKIDASDVVQDVLLKAHEGLPRFRGETEGELVSWLKQILSRNLADLNRRYQWNAGRRVALEVPIDDVVERSSEALRGLPATGTSPSRRAQRREAGVLVADALAALKPDDREVIVLRSLEDLEWGEVARRMRRSPEAVRALWGRAFAHLGEILGERR